MDGHIVPQAQTPKQGSQQGELQQNPTGYSSSSALHADMRAGTATSSSNGICQVPLTHKSNENIMTRTMHAVRDYKTAVKHGRWVHRVSSPGIGSHWYDTYGCMYAGYSNRTRRRNGK